MTGTLAIETDHGNYDVLPIRDTDEGPDAATHTVLHESGERAGYASESGWAWDVSGTPWPQPFASLTEAATEVAETDTVDSDAADINDWAYGPGFPADRPLHPRSCPAHGTSPMQPYTCTCVSGEAPRR